MTNQDMIEYLKEYKRLDRQICRLIEDKQRWFDRALKVTPTWSDMPGGSDGENPRELAMCEAMDCEAEINRLIDQLHELREKVKEYISLTGDNDENLLKIVKIR
ncbi:MAG TPA: hypothetical protein VFD03_06165 [Clostridia bacterium]|nr:hypothetical protein [Clostridia bacterium]